MPRFNGTGPSGKGPSTGRGLGNCSEKSYAKGPGRISEFGLTNQKSRGMLNRGRKLRGFWGRLFGSRRPSGNRNL
jgi:hypothetical protein